MRILDFTDGFASAVQPTIVGVTASSIANVPSGNVTSTTVQAAINEVQTHIDTNSSAITANTTAIGTPTSAATASTIAKRDSNANISYNNVNESFTSVVTSASPVSLTVSSTGIQQFTGSTAQTVNLPATNATGLALGLQYQLFNRSSAVVTVKDSSGSTVQAMAAGSQLIVTAATSGSPGTWDSTYTLSASSALPIVNGGTGQTTANAALNALLPSQASANNKVLKSNGTDTSWGAAGSGGGSKNYLGTINGTDNGGDFESGSIASWRTGKTNGLGSGLPTTTPTLGSGAGAGTTISLVSSGQLSGNYSLAFNTGTSITSPVGDLVASPAITLDISDQAKVLGFKFNYKWFSGTTAVFAGTSANTYGIACWDATNSVWLPLAGNWAMTQSTGVGIASGTVQTGATTASLVFVIYIATPTASANVLYLDDFFLGPQNTVSAPAMTDWLAYTPTLTGFGTPSSISVQSRRVGDSLEVSGRFTAGTSTATPGLIGLGFNGTAGNVSVDTAKIPTNNLVGLASVSTASATIFTWTILAPATNIASVILGVQSSAIAGTTASTNASTSVGTGTTVEFNFKVPIVGWSSNVQMSNDTDTRVVSFYGNASGTLAVTADVTDTTFTSVKDSHGSWSGSVYTVPVSGDYFVSALLGNNASATFYWQYYVNGSVSAIGGAADNTYFVAPGSRLIPSLKAGDTISVRSHQSITLSSARTLSINRLSGPSIVAATESVNARYFACSTSISGSLATLSWTTKDFDSHNAMSAGTFTAPVSGKYQVNVGVALSAATAAAGNAVDLQIQKNGTAVSEVAPVYQGTQVGLPLTLDDIISCNAGDTLRIQLSSAATTPAITGSNSKNFFSISRVGN